MSQRFESILKRLRGLLLGSGWAAGTLLFWLGSNDAFEGPKCQAALVYGAALAAVSFPLLWERLRGTWTTHRAYLAVGGLLVASVLASWLGAAFCLPGNLLLPMERSGPVLVAAFSALVFLLEDADGRARALFLYLAAHCVLLFYGLIQILDQATAPSLGVHVDLIQWVRFGAGRVYSTLGNPDYMAAHLTLLMAFWLGLGWRRCDPRKPAQIAAATLALAPLFIAPAIYGWGVEGDFLRAMGPWLLVCGVLFALCRLLSARACWILLLALLSLLVLQAQGRGAWLAYGVAAAVMAGAGAWLRGPRFFVDRWPVLRWALGALALGAALAVGLLAARGLAPQSAWVTQGSAAKILEILDSSGGRLVHIFDKADDAQVVRRFYWRSALDIGLQHPLVGVGYGNHAMVTARAQSAVWKRWDASGDSRTTLVEPHVELYSHNDFLQNFAETGGLGLAAFLLFWALFVRECWRLARRSAASGDERGLELGLGLLGLAAAFTANAMTNFPWRVLATQQLCWLAFAQLAVAAGPQALPQPAGADKPSRVPLGGLAAVTILALLLALQPLRWFMAGVLFKAGDDRKGDPSAQVQVQGIPFYEKAVQAGPSGTQRIELYLYLGSLYNVAQRPDLAEQWFKKGIESYPDFLEAWYNLGFTAQSRFTAGHNEADRQEALRDYAKVVDINPRAVNALNNMGNLYYGMGDYDRAQDIFTRLLRYDPTSVEAHYNLAAVWVRKGNGAKALEELGQVLALRPDFEPAKNLVAALKRFPQGTSAR